MDPKPSLGATSLGWTEFGTLASEDGPWANDTVGYGYNDARLRSSLALSQPNAAAWTKTYGYDAAWRPQTLSSPAGQFGYTYQWASGLIGNLALPNGAYVTNNYDALGRLFSTLLNNSTNATLDAHSYGVNAAHQRTSQTLLMTNHWDYGYDVLGQMASAKIGRASCRERV